MSVSRLVEKGFALVMGATAGQHSACPRPDTAGRARPRPNTVGGREVGTLGYGLVFTLDTAGQGRTRPVMARHGRTRPHGSDSVAGRS